MKKSILYYILLLTFSVSYSQICDILPLNRLPENGTLEWETAGCSLISSTIEITNYVNVLDHGFDVSGRTDNSDLLDQVFKDLDFSRKSMNLIFFPDGEYLFKKRILVPDNVIIKGNGSTHTAFTFDYKEGYYENYIQINDGSKIGIEDLSIYTKDSYDDKGWKYQDVIEITGNSENCWFRGLRLSGPVANHITISGNQRIGEDTSYITVSGCFFDSTQHNKFGGYGICIDRKANHCLIENNIFSSLRHSMILNMEPAYNVFGYNYSRNPAVPDGLNHPLPDINLHGRWYPKVDFYNGPAYNLFEGNIVCWIRIDSWWDSNGKLNTFMRNYANNDSVKWNYRGFGIQGKSSNPRNRTNQYLEDSQFNQNVVCLNARNSEKDAHYLEHDHFNASYWNEYAGSDPYYMIDNSQASYYYRSKPAFMVKWPFMPNHNKNNPAKRRYLRQCRTTTIGMEPYKSTKIVLYSPDFNNNDLFIYELPLDDTDKDPAESFNTKSYYDYRLVATGDFDGNGHEEIALFRDKGNYIGFFDPLSEEKSRPLFAGMHTDRGFFELMSKFRINYSDYIVFYRSAEVEEDDIFMYEFHEDLSDDVRPYKTFNTKAYYGFSLISAGDFNGDGYQEIALYRDKDGYIGLYDLKVDKINPITEGMYIDKKGMTLMEAVDINSDGVDEIAFYNPGHEHGLFIYEFRGGKSGVSAVKEFKFESGEIFSMITSGDFDDDTVEEIALYSTTDNTLRFLGSDSVILESLSVSMDSIKEGFQMISNINVFESIKNRDSRN